MSATTKATLIGSLLVLIVCRGMVLAQQPTNPPANTKPAAGAIGKSTLEELIAQALKDHPDIRVAEAKLREAEAELSRTRMQVAQKVIAHHAALAAARSGVEEAGKRLAETQKAGSAGAIPKEEIRALESLLAQKKAELGRLETEQPLLLGKWKVVLDDDDAKKLYQYQLQYANQVWKWHLMSKDAAPEGSLPDKVRKALDAPLTVKFQDQSVADVLDFFKGKLGVAFIDLLPKEVKEKHISLVLSEPVPTGAALEALSDVTGLQFAVREYGILVARGDLPPGAVPLHAFWKGAKNWEATPKPTEKKP